MNREEKDTLFTKRVKAGKRTYFFDVRSTKSKDYYLTITESRRNQQDGEYFYEKSKVFIYKEDFEKFEEALNEAISHIKTELLPDVNFSEISRENYVPRNTETDQQKPSQEPDGFSDSELKWE